MASTSLSLGKHWELLIKEEISSGRDASASEVIRDALRVLETRQTKLAALRAHLLQGAEQAKQGRFVENFSMEALISEMESRTSPRRTTP